MAANHFIVARYPRLGPAMTIRRITLGAALLALTCTSAASQSNPTSTSDPRWLLETCRTRIPDILLACNAYLSGFAHSHAITVVATESKKRGFCIPNATSAEEVREVVLAYSHEAVAKQLIKQPEFDTASLVYFALTDRYPCPSENSSANK